MMRRGEIRWADLGAPFYRRPICIVTHDSALAVLTTVVCAPLTTRIRGIASEVAVPAHIRLSHPSVINCDNVHTVHVDQMDAQVLGSLDALTMRALDAALVYALGIEAA